MAKTYFAVIQRAGKPRTLEVIGEGTKPQCEGAIQAVSSLVPLESGDRPLIVVEVTA